MEVKVINEIKVRKKQPLRHCDAVFSTLASNRLDRLTPIPEGVNAQRNPIFVARKWFFVLSPRFKQAGLATLRSADPGGVNAQRNPIFVARKWFFVFHPSLQASRISYAALR